MRLAIRLQPDEGIKLWLMLKEPGAGGMRLQHVPLDMNFAEAFRIYAPEAYAALEECHTRQCDLVHVARRGRSGMALDRSDP